MSWLLERGGQGLATLISGKDLGAEDQEWAGGHTAERLPEISLWMPQQEPKVIVNTTSWLHVHSTNL